MFVNPYKDENSLPEIKLQDNEEIIFSNYRVVKQGRISKLIFYIGIHVAVNNSFKNKNRNM